jgi:hypothetical protein
MLHLKLLFADRKQNLMYKNQTVPIVNQHSVFSAFNTQTARHILKTLQYFLYSYDRWVNFFIKASQAPSYSTLRQSPDNTFPVLLTTGLYTYLKYM